MRIGSVAPSSPVRADVVVVGLGIMGGAVASNLVAKGYAVLGVDPTEEARQRASDQGISVAASMKGLRCSTRVLLTSLPSASALIEVVMELKGWDQAPPVLADLSTLGLDQKNSARTSLQALGVEMLDCPISGTGAQARTGDLSVFGSGSQQAWERLSDVFHAFAKRPSYVGAFGAGTRMKLIANHLVAIHNVATAEALSLAHLAGIDLNVAVDLLSKGAGNSRILELRGPLMALHEYEPATMKLDVWMKDMDLIRQFALDAGANTPLLDATRPIYEMASRKYPSSDTAAVYEVLHVPTI